MVRLLAVLMMLLYICTITSALLLLYLNLNWVFKEFFKKLWVENGEAIVYLHYNVSFAPFVSEFLNWVFDVREFLKKLWVVNGEAICSIGEAIVYLHYDSSVPFVSKLSLWELNLEIKREEQEPSLTIDLFSWLWKHAVKYI